MKKLLLLSLLTLACTVQAMAEKVSEQEAHKIAQQFFAPDKGLAKSMTAPASLQLAHTSTSYYAFNRGENNGYILVATDDCFSKEILGFADKGTFDTNNMPDNMRWWLSEYDRALDATLKAGGNKTSKGVKLNAVQTERANIEPLLSCTWGQGDPYNALCPIYDGGRCITGCVATAVAQLLYYHKYPEVGEGSHEYEWKVNDVSQGMLSTDFSQHTYNYDVMVDDYSESTPQASRDAVAQLMYDAGIASEMIYGRNESYAYFYNAACGFVNNFKYDKSTILLWRNYYEDEEWIDMMYASLASAYPIFYSGQLEQGGGHAFVCDGYRDGYFHINWGWNGYSDGYFLIDGMTPDGYESGYNFDQEAIFNLRPIQDDSRYTVLMYCTDDFTINENEQTTSSYATFSGGFFNYSLTAQSLTLGLKVVSSDNTTAWVESSRQATLNYSYGYREMSVDLSSFPTTEGEYLVYPAYRDNATDTWYEMHTNVSSEKRYLTANVSGNNITFSSPKETTPEEGELIFTQLNNPDVIAEEEFSVQFNMTNNTGEDFSDEIALYLLKEGTLNFVSYSESIPVNLPAGSSTEVTFTLTAPLGAGNYDMVIVNSAMYIISERFPITVEENPESLAFSLLNTSEIIAGNEFSVQFSIANNKGEEFSDEIALYLLNQGTLNFVSYSESIPVNLPAGSSTEVTFTLAAPLEAGNYDMVIVNSAMYIISSTFPITVEENPEGLILSLSSLAIANADNVFIDNINISAQIACERGSYNGYIGFVLFTEDFSTNLSITHQPFSIEANETKTVTHTGTLEGLEEGKTYYLLTAYFTGASWAVLGNGVFFTTAITNGIDEIAQENIPTETEVYNLSGIRLLHFEAGVPLDTSSLEPGIYIVKSGNATKRIIINN